MTLTPSIWDNLGLLILCFTTYSFEGNLAEVDSFAFRLPFGSIVQVQIQCS